MAIGDEGLSAGFSKTAEDGVSYGNDGDSDLERTDNLTGVPFPDWPADWIADLVH